MAIVPTPCKIKAPIPELVIRGSRKRDSSLGSWEGEDLRLEPEFVKMGGRLASEQLDGLVGIHTFSRRPDLIGGELTETISRTDPTG